jgi:hypothetical protein
MSTLTLAKSISIAGGTALFALGTVNMISPAQAASLNLNYSIENLTDGWYNYVFQLKVDNTDNSYVPGQAWGWSIFGDDPTLNVGGEGTLINWVGDLSKSSPWIASFSTSGGGHNGPTLYSGNSISTLWTPSDVNDYLYWSGKSTAKLSQGELLFSTLYSTLNGAIPADFKVANQVDSLAVPEPLTVFGSILGLGVLGAVKRKREKQ